MIALRPGYRRGACAALIHVINMIGDTGQRVAMRNRDDRELPAQPAQGIADRGLAFLVERTGCLVENQQMIFVEFGDRRFERAAYPAAASSERQRRREGSAAHVEGRRAHSHLALRLAQD